MRRSETRQTYEDDRLYCTVCKEQPDYFEEVMDWQVNRVTPYGDLIEVKSGDVREYRCPMCDGRAHLGSELNRRGAGVSP